TGTTNTHYNLKGQVEYIEDAATNRTSYSYDPDTGRKIMEKDQLDNTTYYAYNARNQVTHTWGSATYPAQYVYDNYGQMSDMYTYRNGSRWDNETWPEGTTGTTDVTRWHYDEATGLLMAKEDAAGQNVSYTYAYSWKLASRTWARADDGEPLVTTYSYSPNTGELLKIDYSGTTHDITFTYDRLGRQKTISDAAGTHLYSYNDKLQLASETISRVYDKVITRIYETEGVIGRASGFRMDNKYTVTYGYETATGRFSSVGWDASGDTGIVGYSYLPDSDLLSQVAIGNETEPPNLVTTYSYEPMRDLKTQVKNEYSSNLISQYNYQYDRIGRRTSVANSGQAFSAVTNAFNLYGYDNRSQLTESARYVGVSISDTSNPIQPEYRAYNYDSIGNRMQITEATATGSYTTNALNQYIEQAIPGDAIRDFAYDADGNLTDVTDDTGATQYIYNTENRLIAVEPKNPTDGDKKVEFSYDYMGRRVRKKVYVYGAGAWAEDEERLFVYDGWNMVEEIITKGGQQTSKYYVWGHDLSQSIQGAGGIGGLLASVEPSSGNMYYYCYDVNGNVGQLVNAANGEIAALFEYDPFGKQIVATGSMAEENPFRFSTKYFDEETELYYYGYRYYSSGLGRWLNRDPIAEEGGINLYLFIKNFAINLFDYLGFYVSPTPPQLALAPLSDAPFEILITSPAGTYKAVPCCCKVTIIIKVPSGTESRKKSRKGLSGHIGIAIDNEYYDYGPQPGRGASLFGSPGRPWWDLMAPTSDADLDYILKNIDQFAHGLDVYKAEIEAKQEECDKLKKYWNNLYKDPGTYRFYARQCTTTVARSLEEAEIIGACSAVKPTTMLEQAKKNIKHTCGKNKGETADVIKVYPIHHP
ncbi:MAG: RHS repeat domain-containing protein, partial [bacterium]